MQREGGMMWRVRASRLPCSPPAPGFSRRQMPCPWVRSISNPKPPSSIKLPSCQNWLKRISYLQPKEPKWKLLIKSIFRYFSSLLQFTQRLYLPETSSCPSSTASTSLPAEARAYLADSLNSASLCISNPGPARILLLEAIIISFPLQH